MSLQVEDISVDDMDAWTCTLVFYFFIFFFERMLPGHYVRRGDGDDEAHLM